MVATKTAILRAAPLFSPLGDENRLRLGASVRGRPDVDYAVGGRLRDHSSGDHEALTSDGTGWAGEWCEE